MKLLLKTLFPAILLFVCFFSAHAQNTITDFELSDDIDLIVSGTFAERRVTGKVVGVHDGDTATVLDKDKQQYKFRFNGIDAPELKQDFGNKSKQHLSDLIFGKEVTVIFNKVDKYGRFVGKIMVNGVDANLEQIKAGLAWHYKKYADEQSATDRQTYADAEVKARGAKVGFWTMPNPQPAWDYRAAKKVAQETEKANRKYLVGAKGGCYYLNSSNNKTYVDKKFCNGVSNSTSQTKTNIKNNEVDIQSASQTKTSKKSETGGKTYIRGSRGGCYYLSDSGKKVYVTDKSLCQ